MELKDYEAMMKEAKEAGHERAVKYTQEDEFGYEKAVAAGKTLEDVRKELDYWIMVESEYHPEEDDYCEGPYGGAFADERDFARFVGLDLKD